jgi:uncharacterized protein YdaU (DUF1376 family)
MNYYERHLGDYTRDTAHLSLLEHGVYTILLDRYYVTEEGIPDDRKYRLARAHSKAERNAVDIVLEEFFYLDGGIWKNQRAEEEIADYQNKARANRENGGKGGRPKRVIDNPDETGQKPTENPTVTQPKPTKNPTETHEKPTKNPNQSPVTIKETPSLSFGGKESATEKPNGNPTHNPDAFVEKPSDISSVLRKHGIQCNPQNPKIMALADHRIRISTVSAACQLARDRKPNEQIPANYVIAILEGWVREAENFGETEIKPKETRDAENQRILDELTGRTRRANDSRTIDAQARVIG